MHEQGEEPKRWPALERPWVTWPLRLTAVILAVVLALSWTGRLALSPRLRWAVSAGLLMSLVFGSRTFRERLAAVQSFLLLGLVYLIGVGPLALGMRLARLDPLDLRRPKPSLWHRRKPRSPEELADDVSRQF